jgi:hypothetical protein
VQNGAANGGIPASLIKDVIDEWRRRYGPTFPLYGNETVRHDISGSVRPLLSSTEIPVEKILAERSGVSKKTIAKIVAGEIEFVTHEMADKLITGMDVNHVWYDELADYY